MTGSIQKAVLPEDVSTFISMRTVMSNHVRSSIIQLPVSIIRHYWKRGNLRNSWHIVKISPSIATICDLAHCWTIREGSRKKSGANSTEILNPEDVRSLSDKCIDTSVKWAAAAERLWNCSHACANCKKSVRLS